MEGCVSSMEEEVELQTQQLEEDLTNYNLNFEARVQEVTKEQEDGLKACVKVRNELLENITRIKEGDPACQLE